MRGTQGYQKKLDGNITYPKKGIGCFIEKSSLSPFVFAELNFYSSEKEAKIV